MVIILDTFPASSTGKPAGKTPTLLDQCRAWVHRCEATGHSVFVPAVVYYEALRELQLLNAQTQIRLLRSYCLRPDRFIPLTTAHLELAAELWAKARKAGSTTASPHALDADVIIAAQALSLGLQSTEFVIATTNPNHLSQFVPAELWTNLDV